jgi:2-aminoadipate transaminase
MAKDLSRRAQWAGDEPLTNELMARGLRDPNIISLAAAFIDQDSLPVELVRETFDEIWSDPTTAREALQYGTTIGYRPLREAICEHLHKADPTGPGMAHISTESLVVTSGSNELLYLLADSILDPGDMIICPSPSYFVFLGSLANLGCKAVGVETDAQGVIPESLEARLAQIAGEGNIERVGAVYLISYFDNPTGATLTLDRREAILEIVKKYSTPKHHIRIIEDIAYRDLRYEGDDLPSIQSLDAEGSTVVQIGSFSKSFSPGIRVGWGHFPPDILKAILSQKGNINFGSPNFSQCLMAHILKSGRFEKHLDRLRDVYREKIAAFDQSAEQHLAQLPGVRWQHPTGGLYVWVELPENVNAGADGTLFERAIDQRVLYVPGELCYPETPKKNTLRLSFGVPPADQIRQGVAALGRALADELNYR